MGYFDQHEKGCTPLAPCRKCRAIVFLRTKVKREDIDEFLRILAPSSAKPQRMPLTLSPGENATALSVMDVGFTTRTRVCLQTEGVETIGQLILKTERNLLMLPNFGRRCLNEVKETLQELGLQLEH